MPSSLSHVKLLLACTLLEDFIAGILMQKCKDRASNMEPNTNTAAEKKTPRELIIYSWVYSIQFPSYAYPAEWKWCFNAQSSAIIPLDSSEASCLCNGLNTQTVFTQRIRM